MFVRLECPRFTILGKAEGFFEHHLTGVAEPS